MRSPIRVLFLQSQSFFGADSAIHAQLMRHFDRIAVEVHVACTTEQDCDPAVSAALHIREIPDVRIRPTNFGPSLHATTLPEKTSRMLALPAGMASLLGLALYARRRRIDIIHCTEKPRDAAYGALPGPLVGAKALVHMHVSYGDWQSPLVKWASRRVVWASSTTSSSPASAPTYPSLRQRSTCLRCLRSKSPSGWSSSRRWRCASRSSPGPPAAPEVIVHGETGLLVERGDIALLAEALVALLADDGLRRRMGEAGRCRVERVFTPQRMCEEMREVYRRTLAARARGGLTL